MASASNMTKSHESFRRQKELDEARKAGLAPAALDEDGKEINPHIPQYMTTAPWYLNTDRPTLKHQKDWREHLHDTKQWYDRGAKVFQATKWRKGACENCGAMTHKTKECLERPRNKGAKFTNKHIAPDEKVQNIQLVSFDAKRDRWNGFEAEHYEKVVDRYEKLEEIRKEARKQQELAKRFQTNGATDGPADGAPALRQNGAGAAGELEDEEKLAEDEEAGFAKVEKRVRTTAGGSTGSVRNLRIREDTAKYLLNLDTNSAHYDPKSRSMREDPNPDKDPGLKTFAGDNFVRHSGDYQQWAALNLHSVQAYEGGADIHNVAEPSAAAVLFQQQQMRKAAVASKSKKTVLERYGDAGARAPDDVAALAASEAYAEYDATGRLLRGQEVKARSRYEEDVFINNHTSVWGSWWHDGMWGYACCHAHVKNSYCVGRAADEAAGEAEAQMVENVDAKRREAEARAAAGETPRLQGVQGQNGIWGSEVDGELELDADKLKEAVKRQKAATEAAVEGDERKRRFNAVEEGEDVSAEDMEAYRIVKQRAEDPMLMFKKGDKGGDGYDFV